MEYGYSVLMGIFSAVLLLYAGLMAWTRDYEMLPYRARNAVTPQDPERYMIQLAKVIALTALAPLASALLYLWNGIAAMAVLIAGMTFFLWLGTRIMRDVN